MRLLKLCIVCLVALAEVNTEETCQWMPDGSQVCEGADDHSVWTESHVEDLTIESSSSSEEEDKPDSDLVRKLLSTAFKHQLAQRTSSKQTDLADVEPEIVVASAIGAFTLLDRNDDGYVDYEELASDGDAAEMEMLKKAFDKYSEGKISIFQGLDMLQQSGDEVILKSLLSPFNKLDYMPPASAKKIMQGSVQMFLDADEDNDSQLSKNEFKAGMVKAQERRKAVEGEGAGEVVEEQLDTLFTLIDKDGDKALSFLEFQGTIPAKPKTVKDSMDQIFDAADANGDGSLSEDEFATYMQAKGKAEKIKSEKLEKDINEGFTTMDVNHDGLISRDELAGMFDELKKAQKKKIEEAFSAFDKNEDGSLSKDELEEIIKGMNSVAGQKIDESMFMTMLDKDHDGKISIEEMTDILTTLMR